MAVTLRRLARAARLPAVAALTVLIVLMTLASCRLRAEESPFIFHSLSALPARPVAIVLGAKVFADGLMSDMLRERVVASVALWRAGKVRRLLMSGNDSGPSYDEVAPMVALAEQMGVPPGAIMVDGDSYRTYDSILRARRVFGIRSAIVVTQDFHLPRSLYLAHGMGIDAVGYAAQSTRDRVEGQVEDLRERLASLVAMADVRLRRRPGFP